MHSGTAREATMRGRGVEEAWSWRMLVRAEPCCKGRPTLHLDEFVDVGEKRRLESGNSL